MIFIDPASGFNNPIIFFKSTDLPDPEAPIMASDSPSYKSKLIFFKIIFSLNFFVKFLISIIFFYMTGPFFLTKK